MIPVVLGLAFSFPFPAGWAEALDLSPGEPVAACAQGVSDSTSERFFGALQRHLGDLTESFVVEDCSESSMSAARGRGAELLVALSTETIAVWRVDPGLWSIEPTTPVLLSTTPLDSPRVRLSWALPRRVARIDETALAIVACRGQLFATLRDHLLRVGDGARLDLRPLRLATRVRAGVARSSCAEEGLVVAHADYLRSGVVDVPTFGWRDFSNGLRWAHAGGAWLVARVETGTNRFDPNVSIRESERVQSERWAPWVDAVGLNADFVWLDVEGRLHRGPDRLDTRGGRGLQAIASTPPRLLTSVVEGDGDAVLVLDEDGRVQDRIPVPGAVRDLSLGVDALFVLTEVEGASEIWRIAVEGLP